MPPTRQLQVSVAIASVAVLFAALVFGGVLSAEHSVLVSNLGQSAAPLAAAVAMVLAARRAQRPSEGRAWLLLGASAGSWAVGQMVWTAYDLSEMAAPFPSAADVGFSAAIPLAVAGVWMLVPRSSRATRLSAITDGLILAGGVFGVAWPLVLAPRWDAGGEGTFDFVLSLAYPAGSLVVASSVLLVILRTGGQRTPVPLLQLAAATVFLAAADSIFVWASLNGTEQGVSLSDLCWVTGHLLMLVAAMSYPREAAQHEQDEQDDLSLLRSVLPLGVVGLAWLVRAVMVVRGATPDRVFTGTAVVTAGLLLLRYLLTMGENHRLMTSLQEKVGELTAREEQLSHQALHDPLTGLANRRLFGDRVEHALTRARRTADLTAVLFIDLDDFKTVNDSLGHGAGDRLLEAVGSRLCGCVRAGDTVARLGGDEFGILLEQAEGPDHPALVAARILAALEVPFPLDGRQVFTRASIGVTVAEPGCGLDGDHLLADADVALYAAKAGGKATYRRFERSMRVSALERLELGQDLRRAIGDRQFHNHYQPIVDLVTGRVVALEALVRWEHPERGILRPGSFVELAEDIGVIGEIGQMVLEEALGQGAAWRLAGAVPPHLELHVNLSGRQLGEPDLVERVRTLLATSGYPPHLLVLEITESVAVDIGARHLERLVELRSLGVRLAIDDFGTGYSSLNYLRALPVDVLKIDRAFAQTDDGRTDGVLLEAIVRLGHSLAIEMIAEGIERRDQADMLRRLGCRRAQGYLFHRPVVPEAIPALVSRSGREPAAPDDVVLDREGDDEVILLDDESRPSS